MLASREHLQRIADKLEEVATTWEIPFILIEEMGLAFTPKKHKDGSFEVDVLIHNAAKFQTKHVATAVANTSYVVAETLSAIMYLFQDELKPMLKVVPL